MSISNYPNGFQAGVLLKGLPVVPSFNGRTIWVKPSTGLDGNDGSTPAKAVKTLAQALSLATANKNDVVYLVAESNTASSTTDYQSATLDWNKDGVHLIGVNACPMIGQRSRISNLSTAAALTSVFTVSANNCLISGIEVFNGPGSNNPTAGCVAVTVSGQRNVITNCQISGIGDLAGTMDDADSRSLVVSGSENYFSNCYIGLDTVIRATAAAEVEITGGARNIFDGCVFNTYSSNANMLMVKIAAAIDRFVMFRNCAFIAVQNITSATTITAVMDAASVNGNIHVINPYVSGFTNITAADASRVKVLGLDGTATGHLIGISQGVDVT